MVDLGLMNDEQEILHTKAVKQGSFEHVYNEEFYLTNQNIICIRKGAFGKIKSMSKFSIREISVDESGDARIFFEGVKNNGPKLQIFFRNTPYFFYFQDRNTASEWGNTISQMVTGRPMKNATVEMITKAFNGIKSVIDQEIHKPTAKRCESCGASITGPKGSVVICEFCGFHQMM